VINLGGRLLPHALDWDSIGRFVHVCFHLTLFLRWGVQTIQLFSITPALLNEAEFTVKFRQNDHLKAPFLTVSFQQSWDIRKIRLIEENSPTATICCPLRTLEAFAFFDGRGILDVAGCLRWSGAVLSALKYNYIYPKPFKTL